MIILRATIYVAWLFVMLCWLSMFFGCASPEVDALLLRQHQIQDCILSGGHPHLGPGDTILCD